MGGVGSYWRDVVPPRGDYNIFAFIYLLRLEINHDLVPPFRYPGKVFVVFYKTLLRLSIRRPRFAGGLCGVGHQGKPLCRFSVGCDYGGMFFMTFHDDFVEIPALHGVHLVKAEVVNNEQGHGCKASHLQVIRTLQPGGL